jgi:hypothetical protein
VWQWILVWDMSQWRDDISSSLWKTIELKKQCTLETTSNGYVMHYISTFFPLYALCGFILRRRQYLKLFVVGSTQVEINRRGFGQKRSRPLPNPSKISRFASGIYVNHERHVGIYGNPADIRTWHLPNTRLYRYSCTVLHKSFRNDGTPVTAETIKPQKAMYRHLITNTWRTTW